MRAIFIIVCAAVAAFVAYCGQPFVQGNADLVTVIATVFSVFGGFLIAIIAVIGDPSLIPEGSWRLAEIRRDNIERRLLRHAWLFVLYLMTIAFLFGAVLLAKASPDLLMWRKFVEIAYLFFGVWAFLLSFGLPWALMKLQRARVDAEIERRRHRDGIESGDD